MSKMCYCERCGRTMDEGQFYTSRNLEKYPDGGKLKQCKKCITAHVDNWNPDTYLPILKEIDVPYIKREWDSLLEKYGKDPKKITGMTIIGRYLSKMRMNQFSDYHWADSEDLAERERVEKVKLMQLQGYSGEQIEQQLAIDHTPPRPVIEEETAEPEEFIKVEEEPDQLEVELTDEDKMYLRLKWGKQYRPWEWVWLEQMYNDMEGSYDIQGAAHKDTLKLVCKTSLKAHQLIDMGDIEDYQKMMKVYDQIMKAGKFTAAQIQADKEGIDSIGEFVALCEREGGMIPRYYTDGPQDKVDRTIQDLQNYTRNLITNELNLGGQIENAIKQLEREQEQIEGAEDGIDEDAIFADDPMVTDDDLQERAEFLDENAADDEETIKQILEGMK